MQCSLSNLAGAPAGTRSCIYILVLKWALLSITYYYYFWDKKHLKNVGPIRHCEPPLHCHSPGVAAVARTPAIAQAACDVHDNAWQRGPLWAQLTMWQSTGWSFTWDYTRVLLRFLAEFLPGRYRARQGSKDLQQQQPYYLYGCVYVFYCVYKLNFDKTSGNWKFVKNCKQ